MMFRKKQTKVLRIKEGKKRLINSKTLQELTFSTEVIDFLKNVLGLKTVQILNGQTINLYDSESCREFSGYSIHSETVDILVPKGTNLDGWQLQLSRYV